MAGNTFRELFSRSTHFASMDQSEDGSAPHETK